MLWTVVGAGAGAAIGFAVCPNCPNDGNGGKFTGPGVGIGATVDTVEFLGAAYHVIYKSK